MVCCGNGASVQGCFHVLTVVCRCFSAVIVGGIDMMTQALNLAKKPHIIVGTPGRLVDHLENTKGFNLRSLKYLVRFSTLYFT